MRDARRRDSRRLVAAREIVELVDSDEPVGVGRARVRGVWTVASNDDPRPDDDGGDDEQRHDVRRVAPQIGRAHEIGRAHV